MGKREPPPRDTSKLALLAVRGVALGSSALCGLAIGLGTAPDAIADGGMMNIVLPVGAAALVAVGLGTAWHFVLGIASHSGRNETHKKALAATLGAGLCVIGFGTSAWFLASKIGGASAQQSYRLEHVRKLADAANIEAVNAGSEHGLTAAFEAGASALRASADREARGLITGQKGQGSVYESLMILGGSMGTTYGALGEAEKRRDDLLTRAHRDIAEAIKAATGNDATLFQQAAARAAREIADADNIRLRDIAANFASGVVVAPKARANVDDVISRMNNALARAEDNRRPVSVPVYVPVTAKDAVMSNPPPLAWLAAGVIEFLPLIGLAILLLLWRERERERSSDDDDDDAGAAAPAAFPPMRVFPLPSRNKRQPFQPFPEAAE